MRSSVLVFNSSALLLVALSSGLLAGTAEGAGAVELTMDNWEEKRGTRNAFVKFLAPW